MEEPATFGLANHNDLAFTSSPSKAIRNQDFSNLFLFYAMAKDVGLPGLWIDLKLKAHSRSYPEAMLNSMLLTFFFSSAVTSHSLFSSSLSW